jgi:hypothetical protein
MILHELCGDMIIYCWGLKHVYNKFGFETSAIHICGISK